MTLAPYEHLVALAEHEACLVASGAWDDLPALAAEREATIAALPAVAAPEALPALQRLAGLQQLVSAALGSARAGTVAELAQLGRGRGAVQGYATSAAQSGAASARLDDSA